MKTFRFLGVALITTLLSVNITSCNKEDEGPTGGNSIIGDKRITKLVTDYSTTTFVYDDKGRVVESQQNGEVCPYIWGNNTIQREWFNGVNAVQQIFTIKNGLVQKEECRDGYYNEIFTYTYDSRGRWNKDMTWDGDKLVLEYIGDAKYKYNYTGLTCNKGYLPNFNTDELFTIHPELVGIQTTQLPTSAIRTITGGPSSGESGSVAYEYEFDEEGYITKVTEIFPDETYTYTISWE